MPLRIENKENNKAEIVIYGTIGASMWDPDSISAKQVHEELKKISDSTKEITVRINSPGGDVFDGITIYNLIKQKKGRKTVCIDGLAASIASIIAMAGDEIVMSEGAQMMIHKPWTYAAGNADELENVIQRLDDVEEQMISIYRKKTNLERAEIRDMLRNETYMTSELAIEKGFATKSVDEGFKMAASLDKAVWLKKKPVFENKKLKEKISGLKSNIQNFLDKK